ALGENPALGRRGLRFCLANPEIFRAQLTALCLASQKGDLRILLPMVTSLSELREARRYLVEAASAAGLSKPPSLGVMVEVPSAAILADRFAPETDFFSIGTNDLAQYALAVDRANPEVAPMYRPFHPAILRLIRLVVSAGADHGRSVAVCGELAADPLGIGILVGLGISEVSVTPVSIPIVKDHLAGVDSVRARALAEKALLAAGATEVERLFRGLG
ncbi:MAG: putative PEP-binding protein, partial [Acidobacteriota bacterium]